MPAAMRAASCRPPWWWWTGRADPWAGRPLDLRVDRSADPIGDLGALLVAADAYAAFERGVDAMFGGDPGVALAEIDRGLAGLPGEENLVSFRAGALAAGGDFEAARAELRALVARRPGWATIVRGFAAKGLLTLPPSTTIDDILG
jgi:hypothetical protein